MLTEHPSAALKLGSSCCGSAVLAFYVFAIAKPASTLTDCCYSLYPESPSPFPLLPDPSGHFDHIHCLGNVHCVPARSLAPVTARKLSDAAGQGGRQLERSFDLQQVS